MGEVCTRPVTGFWFVPERLLASSPCRSKWKAARLAAGGAVSIKAKKTLTLVETGKNAVSDLPKGSVERQKK